MKRIPRVFDDSDAAFFNRWEALGSQCKYLVSRGLVEDSLRCDTALAHKKQKLAFRVSSESCAIAMCRDFQHLSLSAMHKFASSQGRDSEHIMADCLLSFSTAKELWSLRFFLYWSWINLNQLTLRSARSNAPWAEFLRLCPVTRWSDI